MHGVKNVALFPLRAPNVASVPVEKEYLTLYPSIEWMSLKDGYEGYCVRVPGTANTFWTLANWLKV